MESKKAIIFGVSWTIILNLFNGLYGFVSVPLLLMLYGKSHYGLITIAMSINVYLRLLDLGLNSTNVKFYSALMAKAELGRLQNLFKTSFGLYLTIGLVNSLCLLVVGIFSDRIFNIDSEETVILRHLIWILAASAVFNWISSCFNQVIMASEQVSWVQQMAIIPKLFQFLILLLIYIFKFNIETYFFLTCFSIVLVLPCLITKVKKTLTNVEIIPKIDKEVLKMILPYCMNIFSFSLLQYSMEALKPIFIAMRMSSSAVAEYKIIGSIVTLAIMVGGSFMGVILPSVSKAKANHNREAIEKVAYQGTKFISLTLSFCAFGLIVTAYEVITIYVGSAYVHLVPWLCFWLLLSLFSHNQGISSIILAGDDIKVLTYSVSVAVTLGLITCWMLIPAYGIGGAICAHLVYCIVQFCFYYGYYWRVKLKLHTKKIFIKSFMSPVIGGFLSASFVYFIFRIFNGPINNVWFVFILKGIAFTVCFMLIQYILVLNESDKQLIRRIVLKTK